ncbi:MAG TPA: BRCT domain-containing protein [Methylomirabilota bacterium]|nr:BRCT domain-containing protein [Methylomirabilota bacterium]
MDRARASDTKNFEVARQFELMADVAQASVALTEPRRAAGGRLAGKSFVLTGALSGLTRDEAIDRLARLGARVSGRASRKTDYVVLGDRPGEKLAAARRLGIPTLSECEFLALMGGRAA